MIKLIDLLKEDSPFVPRGGKERVEAYSLKRKAEIENKIQQYIKDGMEGDLDLFDTPITSLPPNLTKVGGDLILNRTKITSLNNLTKVEGDLNLFRTPITSLPDNLTVKGELDLNNSKISKLPNNLTVGGDLYLDDTPLSKKYSEDEIRAMVPNIEGEIYI
jgi:hypothetical protein